jgi:hypothetical protein
LLALAQRARANWPTGAKLDLSYQELTTAAAEMKWLNDFSVAATFEGEFSNVTRSYPGKGIARYSW